ncbi:unnamed protein product [Urochloa humidicola]
MGSATAILLVSVVLLLNSQVGFCGCFKRIFSFGDSIIDTGNFVRTVSSTPIKDLPYGMTYFNYPTGRVSDGRVIIDFYAQALGLPLVPPSIPEEGTSPFPTGANFAVLAATGLPPNYYAAKYNFKMPSPSCLDLQLESFKKVLARIAGPGGDAERRRVLGESLVVMGEIGGNDYNFWFLSDRGRSDRGTPDQYMPDVVGRVGAAVQEVIDLGARTVLVPGNFPIGCVPQYLTTFQSGAASDYDGNGCLVWFNDFSRRHNGMLQEEVRRLRARNPGARIIFADYFGAAMEFVQNPQRYGIDDPLVACCGGAGRYHTYKGCDRNATVWGSPGKFANWDGIHMTEKAYSVIADGVLNGPFADTPLLKAC